LISLEEPQTASEPSEAANPHQLGLTAVMVLIVGGITGAGSAMFGVLPSSRLAFTVPASAEVAIARPSGPVTAADHPDQGG
jgi:hypothetical protein